MIIGRGWECCASKSEAAHSFNISRVARIASHCSVSSFFGTDSKKRAGPACQSRSPYPRRSNFG